MRVLIGIITDAIDTLESDGSLVGVTVHAGIVFHCEPEGKDKLAMIMVGLRPIESDMKCVQTYNRSPDNIVVVICHLLTGRRVLSKEYDYFGGGVIVNFVVMNRDALHKSIMVKLLVVEDLDLIDGTPRVGD